MFFSQHFSFVCQYHSKNVPYSFIRLPPTLYNVFLPVLSFPVSIIPPMPHTLSFVYHRLCIMFFSQHFSFPCECHSINASYSFIRPLPTLYNVFLPRLQFLLSVSFHRCCILSHSSTIRLRIMFFSQHFRFLCQYHSTNVPYSFIRPPPTLYCVFFLPALQFPLSLSFHQ